MGMREEVEVISAVCENKDIHVLFENNVDYMMQSCGDVWDFVKEYYNETRQVPPSDLLQTRFRDFDTVENPSPTIYAVNRLKETFLDESLRTTVRKAAQFLQDNQSGKALNTMSTDISSLARITARVRDLDVTDIEDALQ